MSPLLPDPALVAITHAPAHELVAAFDEATLREALGLQDWLLREGFNLADPDELNRTFAERLIEIGVPLDRLSTAIATLHSEYRAIAREWTREKGSSSFTVAHESGDGGYKRSPYYHVEQTGEWLRLHVPDAPEELFSIMPELKASGMVDYICVPLFQKHGRLGGLTVATKTADGFRPRDIRLLAFVLPTLSTIIEMRLLERTLDQVLRIYIGDEPHRRVLSGEITRGQVTTIRSAILFADMRGYTAMTMRRSIDDVVSILNTYFDCVVPPIEAQGGEVLKYMGDGLMAVFRDKSDDTGGAATSALAAAQTALQTMERANAEGLFPEPVTMGIALHHGEAAYGNVGSRQRLDFTIVGPDVNLTSRVGQLNKVLGEPLLLTSAFADQLWRDVRPLGRHMLAGVSEPVLLFKP